MEHDTHITIRISAQALEALDDIRRREADVPSRAAMIRRLIIKASASGEQKPAPKRHKALVEAVKARELR